MPTKRARKRTPATPATPATPSSLGPTRLQCRITAEAAATIREEDEILAATVDVAKAMVLAATQEGNRLVERAQARHAATMKSVLRTLSIDDGTFIGVSGFGDAITADIDVTPQMGVANG